MEKGKNVKTKLLMNDEGMRVFGDQELVIEESYVMAKRLYFDRNPDMEVTQKNKRIVIVKKLVAAINES